MRLKEGGRQADRQTKGVFGPLEVAFNGQRDTKIEVDNVVINCLVAVEPCLICDNSQWVLALGFILARNVEQFHEIKILLPDKQYLRSKVRLYWNHLHPPQQLEPKSC